MPEAMTHYYFATEMINSLDEKFKKQMNYSDARVFLYANFYDLPYYYRLSNFFKKKTYNLGFKLHNIKTKELIELAIKFIRENGYDKDNILMLYCLVTHYVLDKTIHPYINSLAGLYKRHDKGTYMYRGNHGLLERAIDHELVLKRENLNLADIKLTKKFKGAYIFNFADLELINHLIKTNYYFPKAEDYFKISLRNFKHFMRYTSHDFLKFKTCLYKLNDKLFNRKSATLTANFIYKKNYKLTNFMNETHQIWLHPTTEESANLSFDELYKKAINDCHDYFDAISNYLFYNNSKQFKQLFDGSSLDTGGHAKTSEMQYASPLFLHKKDKKKNENN